MQLIERRQPLDVCLVIKQRREDSGLEQRELAAAAEVIEAVAGRFVRCERVLGFGRSGGLELSSQGAFEEGAELARTRRVAELAERLNFDLADTLTGEGEHLTHFVERVLAAVIQPEAHPDDFFFAGGQRLQC